MGELLATEGSLFWFFQGLRVMKWFCEEVKKIFYYLNHYFIDGAGRAHFHDKAIIKNYKSRT